MTRGLGLFSADANWQRILGQNLRTGADLRISGSAHFWTAAATAAAAAATTRPNSLPCSATDHQVCRHRLLLLMVRPASQPLLHWCRMLIPTLRPASLQTTEAIISNGERSHVQALNSCSGRVPSLHIFRHEKCVEKYLFAVLGVFENNKDMAGLKPLRLKRVRDTRMTPLSRHVRVEINKTFIGLNLRASTPYKPRNKCSKKKNKRKSCFGN